METAVKYIHDMIAGTFTIFLTESGEQPKPVSEVLVSLSVPRHPRVDKRSH